MSVETPDAKLLVIDTGEYAGNFERRMCAYVTGQVGECQVGEEEAEKAVQVLKHLEWIEDHIQHIEDEYGCERPVSIWPTEGQMQTARHPAYNSVAIFFDEVPPAEVLAEMVARAIEFCAKKGLAYKGYRLLEPVYQVKVVEMTTITGYKACSQ